MRYRQARQYTPRSRQHSRQGADSTADREPTAQQVGSTVQAHAAKPHRHHVLPPLQQLLLPLPPLPLPVPKEGGQRPGGQQEETAPQAAPAACRGSGGGGPVGSGCKLGQRSAVQQKFSWQGTRQGTALPVAYLLWRCREGRALSAPPPPRMRLQQSRAGPPRRPVAARQLRLCCS